MEVKKAAITESEFGGMMIEASINDIDFAEYVKIVDGQAVVERTESNVKLNMQDALESYLKSTLKEGETLVVFGTDDYRCRTAEGELNALDADDIIDALEEAAQEAFKSLYIDAYDKAIVDIISDFSPAADKESGSPWCLADIDYVDAATVSQIEEQARSHAEEHAPEIAKLLADDFENADNMPRIILTDDDKYNIYDIDNCLDVFGRCPDGIDFEAIKEAFNRTKTATSFEAFKRLAQSFEPIKSLDDLYIKMLRDHPSTLDRFGQWSSDLPTFGGEEPDDTEGVWSWDEKRLIVGSFAGDLEIIERKR